MYRSGAYLVQEFVFYFIKINKNRRIITQVHSHLPHSTKPPPSPLFLSKPSLPRKSATFTVTRVSRTFCGWYIIPQGIWSKAEPTTTIYWVNNILLLHGERCYRDRQTDSVNWNMMTLFSYNGLQTTSLTPPPPSTTHNCQNIISQDQLECISIPFHWQNKTAAKVQLFFVCENKSSFWFLTHYVHMYTLDQLWNIIVQLTPRYGKWLSQHC